MGRVIKSVLSYLVALTMVFGIVSMGGIGTVNAAVDTQKDMERFILVLESTNVQDREDVVKLIATKNSNGIYEFNTGINPDLVKANIAAIVNKNIADPTKQITQTTIVNALNYMKDNASRYGAYINAVLTVMSKSLDPLADSTKETTANKIVLNITEKFYSYNLFLNFLTEIKSNIGNVVLFYTSNDKIELSDGMKVAIAISSALQNGSQGERYSAYKALFEGYIDDVNNWSNLTERRAFISDLKELSLCIDKPASQNPGTGSTTTPTTIPDGTVNTTTDANGDKISTVTINQQAIDTDTANAQAANVTLDLTAVLGSVQINTELTGAMIDKIAESGKGLELKVENATMVIPAEVIKQISQLSNEKVTISISIVKDAPAVSSDMKSVGQVLEFTIKAGNNSVSGFEKKVKVQIKVDSSKMNDPRKVIASYYNEATKQWEPVNGYVDKQTGILIFFADHFSKYAAMEYNKKFSDVTTAWAKDSIEVLAARNIMNGVGGDKFNPKANITRAEVAAIIVRALNIDTKVPMGKFADVASSKWYAKEVEAAERVGIVTGVGNNKFAPDAQVTREQIAAMICRALEYKQGKISTIPAISFTDASKISAYAKNAVAIAASKGIILGSDNKFEPANKATREQVAVMLYRLLETLGEISK